MANQNRSTKKFIQPILGLLKGETTRPQVTSIGVYCGCSDGVTREVDLDIKLGRKVLGFIQHNQGGILKMNAGRFAVSREKDMDVVCEHTLTIDAVLGGQYCTKCKLHFGQIG